MKNTFSIPIIPTNDEERLKALYRYEILDTPPEGAFNHVAELAVKIFNVPIALISLVDRERVFFKANVGMPGVSNVGRGLSLCSLAVLQKEEPVVFENAEKEPCLLANPMVAGSFGLRFYAGAPLITIDGFNIGTLCLVDKKVRKFSEEDRKMLQDLAAIVMDEMEIRISSIKAFREQRQLLHIAAHDLKNPLQNIQALTELLKNKDNEDLREKFTDLIHDSSIKMISLINRLVKLSEIENAHFTLDLKELDAGELVDEVVKANMVLARKKDQQLIVEKEITHLTSMDMDWMREVFDNLINNAIKYSPYGKTILVKVKSTKEYLYFQVQDEGPGFSEQDLAKAFEKFARLSSTPTGEETSTGLGLSIVKTLVELHKGTVEIVSKGKNKGSKMLVKIPNLPSETAGKEKSAKKRAAVK